MNESLTRFFQRTPPVTLDTCDREQIHFSGAVQKTGGLLVLDPGSMAVIGASENAGSFLGRPVEGILGQILSDVAPDIAEALGEVATDEGTVHEVLEAELERDGVFHDVICHAHDGRLIIEFIPNCDPQPTSARRKMRACSKACAQILNAETFEDALQITVDTVRALTGFDKVMIYRFLPDWSGATIAESKVDPVPSYLGLHFPDTDIPKQVRAIMEIVPYRCIGTVSDDTVPIRALQGHTAPLDLTWSMTRSVSSMHTAYLRNMGISATFSCSLKNEGAFWGLIACHHTEPATVPVDCWSLIQEIATALMLRYDQKKRADTSNMIAKLRRIENQFASELRRSGEVEDVISTLVPVLREFFRADGFAFQYGNRLHTSGVTPPENFIRDLIRWSQKNPNGDDQLQTVSLHKIYPPAAEHMKTACGVLIQPIVMHRVCQLIWFRAPITRRVSWAGRPGKKTVADRKTGLACGPRESFDRWVQEHNDESLQWEPAELASAREIFQEFLDIIASQVLLKEENTSLRQFAHMAAHDIKTPLRGIDLALKWMKEDADNFESMRENREFAATSVKRLQTLTESLLEYSLLSTRTRDFTATDPEEAARDAVSLVRSAIRECEASVFIEAMPAVISANDLLVRVFMNLVTNAIKYREPGRKPRVHVYASAETEDRVTIAVEDNGTGIEPRFAETIFDAGTRLVREAQVSGSGFGLSICSRIMELHGGRIFLDGSYTDGARFFLEFPKV